MFISVKDGDKPRILPGCKLLVGHRLHDRRDRRHAAISGSARLAVERINKVAQGRPHIVDRIVDGGIALIFNTTEGLAEPEGLAGIRVRRRCDGDPVFHDRSGQRCGGERDRRVRVAQLEVRPLQSYYAVRAIKLPTSKRGGRAGRLDDLPDEII